MTRSSAKTRSPKTAAPVYSMTGFGSAKRVVEGVQIEVEIKSVNHRYLDLNFKLPAVYSRHENQLSELLRKRLRRGHVDLYINRRAVGERGFALSFNSELFKAYLSAAKNAFRIARVDEKSDLSHAVLELLKRREVLDVVLEEGDAKREIKALEAAVCEALEELTKMRRNEGLRLGAHLAQEISRFKKLFQGISREVPESIADYKKRLEGRLAKIKGEVALEPARLAQEVVLFAERLDITEELTRLASHLDQWQAIIDRGEGGRKLEFLLQEFGREVNTIGSKSQSAEISAAVVELKSILEKLREQVQNVE